MRNTNQSGRSMLEMIAVVAIAGMMIVGAATFLYSGYTSFKERQIAMEVENLATGVTELYSWVNNYDGLNMNTICQNDVLDRRCINNRAWTGLIGGGQMTVHKANTDGSDCTDNCYSFYIQLTEIPEDICLNLIDSIKMGWSTVIPITNSCSAGGNTIRFQDKESRF